MRVFIVGLVAIFILSGYNCWREGKHITGGILGL
jgi:hypothetical protein